MNRFIPYLQGLPSEDWEKTVQEIQSWVHEVDRSALEVWFSFWPLSLHQQFQETNNPEELALKLGLDGDFRLENFINSSTYYFFGHRYWPEIKIVASEYFEIAQPEQHQKLAHHILEATNTAAQKIEVEAPLLVGLMACAFMTARQVPSERFAAVVAPQKSGLERFQKPEDLIGFRNHKRPKDTWVRALKGSAKRFAITYDERQPDAHFFALMRENLSTAAGRSSKDFRDLDRRMVEGPIPAQCRSAACGYCWIGVLDGHRNLGPITEFERRRLQVFGYLSEKNFEEFPKIRLACQTRCAGPATVVVAPWNGVLNKKADLMDVLAESEAETIQ